MHVLWLKKEKEFHSLLWYGLDITQIVLKGVIDDK